MRLFQKFRPEHFFLFCLLATSFKAKAAENIPQTAPSTQPVLTSTIFKDPSDYATYGGTAGNQVFQHYAQQMPGFVANNIRAKQSFEKIFSDMTLTRGKVARESKTPEANLFETLRVKEANPNKDSVASITPVLKYPYMTRLMRSNVQSLEQTNDFKPLDDLFEYQYLKFNARQWLEVIAKFHTVENVIASAVYRMFKGKDGKGDYSTLVFDYKNGWNNGTLQVNPHYTVALLKAFSDAEKGIIDDTVKISYIRVRFKGTDVDTRSIMFPTDNTTKEDLSNIPLALVHPSLENMEYHINQVKAAFEDARRATGDEENKRRRIAKFSYLFALTMPLIRGSAAVNEWMTSGLFEYHKLIGPHKMMDEIAQSSFTFDQFYQEYYKTSFIPKELSSSDIKEFEDFYEKYFYRVTNKSIFEDFLSQPSGVTTQKRDQEVVISLTSYPERMPTTWAAIESLLRQTEKPDRIVLNLFEGEFPDKKLPWPIEQQLNRGLEINWSPINRKVFLKVIPTFQKYPNAAVVAFDDDNIYPNDRLKVLLDAYKEHPDCVIGQDVRVIPSIDGVIPPVAYWLLTGYTTPNEEMEPAFNLAPEGYQGILYPPHSLFDHFDDATFYERLCPTDDDIWMYTSTIAKGFKTFKPKNTTQKLNFIERAQKSSKTLGAINGQDQNRLYNVYMERITKEGFLQNAGFNALETDAINFLKKSITSIPKEVSVSSYKHTEMLNAPIVFDSPFTVLLRDGIFLRGPVGSFKVLASAFKTAKFAIKMHVAPVLTPKQPLIAYALKYQGRIFKQGIINQQLPFIEFEYDVKEDVQVYELLTTATQQNANWITFCINKIEFN